MLFLQKLITRDQTIARDDFKATMIKSYYMWAHQFIDIGKATQWPMYIIMHEDGKHIDFLST